MKKLLLNGIIDVNCYIIPHEDKVLLIDPGSDYEILKNAINEREVAMILLTHGHMDHIDLIGHFSCPIYIHNIDIPLLSDNDSSCYSLLNEKPSYDYRKLNVKSVQDGDEIRFFDETFTVIHTPGHTAGSVCYLHRNQLFSGDTLFKESIGRTDLPTGSQSSIQTSVIRLLETLDDQIKVYPGHGENTTIRDERKNNPYYLIWKKHQRK